MRSTTLELEGVETFCTADTHDGSRDGVGGGDGHPKVRRGEEHGSAGRFRRKAVNRIEFDHFLTESLDNAPAAGGSSGTHGKRAENFHPGCDVKRLTGSQALGSSEMKARLGKASKLPEAVPATSARAMMPIVFCASFVKWAKPM